MPIAISCPNCRANFRLPDELAGKKVRCQKCKQTFVLPAVQASGEPPVLAPISPPTETKPAIPSLVLDEPAADEEILDAEEVAETAEQVEPAPTAVTARAAPPPLPSRSGAQKPPSAAAPRRRPLPAQPSSSGIVWVLAAFGLVGVLGLCVLAGLASYLLLTPQPAQPVVAVAPPPIEKEVAKEPNILIEKKVEEVKQPNPPIEEKKVERQVLEPAPLPLDGNGKANVNGVVIRPPLAVDAGRFRNYGALCLYSVPLDQGKTYNVHVKANAFSPRLHIFDGQLIVAQRQTGGGIRDAFLSITAKRTGDYLILVSSLVRIGPDGFTLNFAPVSPAQVTPIDLTVNPKFSIQHALRIEDPLDPTDVIGFAPYREYSLFMEANTDYEAQVSGMDFPATLAIYKQNRQQQKNLFRPQFDVKPVSYRYLAGGEVRLRVSSMSGQLGNYTLSVSRKGEVFAAKKVQSIIVALNAEGDFDDRRTLTDQDGSEPNLANRGPCKEYLVPLTKGRNYAFELTAETVGMHMTIYDEDNKFAIGQACKPGVKALAIFSPLQTGLHKLYVAAALPKTTGMYALHIRDKDVVEEKPGPRIIVFGPGDFYRREDHLRDSDPAEPKPGLGFYKTYLVPMEAGFSYNFTQKSKELNAFLKLYDPQDKLVAQDNDSGGDFNARILFDAKATGQYRLQAYDTKGRTGAFTLEATRFKLPVSSVVNQPLKSVTKQEAGCKIFEAEFGRSLLRGSFFAWAKDGKSFYVLDADGTVARIRLADFVEEQRLLVGKGADQLHMTAEGLLVANPKTVELWLIDPETLQVSKRLPQQNNGPLFTAAGLKFAYANTIALKENGMRVPALVVYDLSQQRTGLFTNLPVVTQFAGITPDGNYLLGRTPDSKLTRWRVNGAKITLEETSALAYRGWASHPLAVSADSQWLVHPVSLKLKPRIEVQLVPPSNYGVAVYKVNDLKQPAFALGTTSPTATVTIDPKTGTLYTHTFTRGLIVSDLKGNILKELPLDKTTPIWRIEIPPEGGKLLAFIGLTTAPRILQIELPRE